MPPEIESLAETPEDKAALSALQNETEIELVQPEEKPEPEPKPEAVKPEAKPEERKPVRLVPHEALHEEREKRKALERRIAEIEKPKPPAQAEEDIDETQDPIGAIAKLKAELKAERDQRQRAKDDEAQLHDLATRTSDRVKAYAAEHPEYQEQVKHLRGSRFEELVLLGMPEEAAAQQITREEIQLAQAVLDQDGDLGSIIAKLAVHRGWKAKEEPAPKPLEQSKLAPEDEGKIERLQRGQRAAKSPSAAGGGGPEAEMTLERLLSLDGAAFDQAFKKHGSRLMGGG